MPPRVRKNCVFVLATQCASINCTHSKQYEKKDPVVGKLKKLSKTNKKTKRLATTRVELFCPSVDVCAVRPLPCFAVAFLFCNGNASCKNSVPKFWKILFAKAIAVLLFRRLFSKQWFWTKHACFSSVCSQQIFECEQV